MDDQNQDSRAAIAAESVSESDVRRHERRAMPGAILSAAPARPRCRYNAKFSFSRRRSIQHVIWLISGSP